MKRATHNFLVIIVITAMAVVAVFAANTTKPFGNSRFFDFPMMIADWNGRNLQMNDYVYQLIETKYMFLRDYQSPRYSAPINLSIVWFDDTNISFHAPEACLGGVGNKVKGKSTIAVGINGKDHTFGKLTLDQTGGKKSVVLYYFDVDGYWTLSQADIRLHIFGKRLLLKRSSASFIRLMAPVITNEEDTITMMLDFLKTAIGIMPDYLYTEHLI